MAERQIWIELMSMEQPRGRSGIRARRIEHAHGSADRPVFRIEDRAGRVLRKVKGARDPQEALALYWRRAGAAVLAPTGLEAAMSKDLERRIRRARAGTSRADMQTPELPFQDEPLETGSEARRVPRRGRLPRAVTPQIDLFGESVAAGSAGFVAAGSASFVTAGSAGFVTVGSTPFVIAVSADLVAVDSVPDASAADAAPEPKPVVIEPVSEQEPYGLDPVMIGLGRVDARNLRPTDRADQYLYHITNGSDAEVAMRSGLLVSASDPIILSERQGVAYWLSVVAEDYDYILDGPADFVVLRLRRMAVDGLLEHDQHASRSAGCPCYLLTGGASLRDPD